MTKTSEPMDQKQTYEVSLPEGWDSYMSVGEFRIASQAFYCPVSVFNGMYTQVLCYWSLKNLTAEPLYLEVNYRSKLLEGPGGTGLGVGFLLRPRESRPICSLFPVRSAIQPVVLQIRFCELRLPGQHFPLGGQYYGLSTEIRAVSPSAPSDFHVANEDESCARVAEPRLASDYVLDLSIGNPDAQSLRLVAQTSVGDPSRGLASFAEREIEVDGRKTSVVQAPYIFPSDQGEKPLLTYRVSEAPDVAADNAAALEMTKDKLGYVARGDNVLSAGSIDLTAAAEKGLVRLPEYKPLPVEERAKLIEQRQSEHFLFRYRPDSYAAANIEQAVKDREEAYQKLKSLLQMDLPDVVTIDLYPDMEAKGLGSGTTWTPANTVTNTHVAEVYNDSYRCDSRHELAHIFTYHFGGGSEGVLCEHFAASCQVWNGIPKMMEEARQRLGQGRLSSLESVLLTSKAAADDTTVFIHYLMELDLARFKQFYVRIERVKERGELDAALQEVYGTDLAGVERQWQSWLVGSGAACPGPSDDADA